MVEVAVAAVAEAVAGHVDRRAEAVAVEQRGEEAALLRGEHGRREGEAALVERSDERGPVEGVDAGGQVHARATGRGRAA
jgi:hypothetical protein